MSYQHLALIAAAVLVVCILVFLNQKEHGAAPAPSADANGIVPGAEYRIASRMPPGMLSAPPDSPVRLIAGAPHSLDQAFTIIRDGASYRIKTADNRYWYFDPAVANTINAAPGASDPRGLFTLARQADGALTIFSNTAGGVLVAQDGGYYFQKIGGYFPDQAFDFTPLPVQN